jgi:arsenate reductase
MNMPDKKTVLFVCTGNSARSQMAEGLLRHAGASRFSVASAGTHPTYVRPEAVMVMKEVGIDISGHRSKAVDEFAGQEFDYIITVCDNAKETCPVFPGKAERLHWSFEDPAAAEGSDEQCRAAFRKARDEISARIGRFLSADQRE